MKNFKNFYIRIMEVDKIVDELLYKELEKSNKILFDMENKMPNVRVTAEFDEENIMEALTSYYDLPHDARFDFVLGDKSCGDPREEPYKIFKCVKVEFDQKLGPK